MNKNEKPPNDRLREHRESKKLSLKAMAEKLSTSDVHLARLERAECGPGLDLAARIEAATRIPMRAWVKP